MFKFTWTAESRKFFDMLYEYLKRTGFEIRITRDYMTVKCDDEHVKISLVKERSYEDDDTHNYHLIDENLRGDTTQVNFRQKSNGKLHVYLPGNDYNVILVGDVIRMIHKTPIKKLSFEAKEEMQRLQSKMNSERTRKEDSITVLTMNVTKVRYAKCILKEEKPKNLENGKKLKEVVAKMNRCPECKKLRF